MMKIKLSMINRVVVLSFLCVAVLAIVMGFALSTFLTRAVSGWEGESTAAFIRHQAKVAGLDTLFTAPQGPGTQQRWAEEMPRLFASLPGVVRYKAWDREGTVLWSDDAALIGQRPPGNPDLQTALTGKVVAGVKELTKAEHAQETRQFGMLAEVYVPIFSKGTKEVLGVLEIYKIPAELFVTLRRGLILIWAISLAGGAALCLVLLLLVKQLLGREPRAGDLRARGSSEGTSSHQAGFEPVSARPANEIRVEIEERFGFFPPFFEPAMATAPVMENLWQQTLSAYLSNPLPALFKEKLFAYLSRYCAVPYCIVCHSCALRPLGMTAGEVLTLLELPPPTEQEIAEQLAGLVDERASLTAWPEPGSALDATLMNCSIFMFLRSGPGEHCQAEMRRLLGPALYSRLTEFLCYVKTCHLWVEAHPELAYEADRRAQEHLGVLIEQEPRLIDFFRDYGDRVKRERRRREEAELLDEGDGDRFPNRR